MYQPLPKETVSRKPVFIGLSIAIALLDSLFVFFNYRFTEDAFLAEFAK